MDGLPFDVRRPGSSLADTVELLWLATSDAPGGVERVLPSARPQLLINLVHDRLYWADPDPHHVGGAAISGPFCRAITIDRTDQQALAGAVFRPGGLAALLDPLPVHAVANTTVDLHDLLPTDAVAPGLAQIRRAPLARVLLLLERWLADLLHRRPDPALACASRSFSVGARVGDVADELGMSQRVCSRWFREGLGLRPKRYGRVRRLQRALAFLEDERPPAIGDVAFSAGYADHAHMGHDFRELAGLSPSEWLARRHPRGWRNHVPS